MKKLVTAGALIAGLFAGSAIAGDSLTACQEFADTNGVSPEPCECIAEAVADNPELMAEQIALVTMEDWENASSELHAALDPCIGE